MVNSDLAPLWKALADPKRRLIIQILQDGPRTTSEISNHFDVSRFAIMRHLKVLEQADLISTRREGRQRWSTLNEHLFKEIQQTYLDERNNNSIEVGEVLGFLSLQDESLAKNGHARNQQSLEIEVELNSPPARVFQALTAEIDRWWSYRFSDESQMYLEPEVGGRFYEAFRDGGGVLYAFVTLLRPDEEVCLRGSMGLSDEFIDNNIRIHLQSQAKDETRIELIHHIIGKSNLITIETFKRSWIELLTQNLKSFIEKGDDTD